MAARGAFLPRRASLSTCLSVSRGLCAGCGSGLRSPLYDKRVVEFACARPREERNDARETKRLLRAAMRGLLPDEVLAPRASRTGITTAYSDRRMRSEFPLLLARHGKMQMLADLGIVDPGAMRRAWEEYCRTGSTALKIPLFLTMHVARLRAQARAEPHLVDETDAHAASTHFTIDNPRLSPILWAPLRQ